ncbi:MAG: N-acetylglucosamine-6-phosphate deacetylase, partial [Actinomadura rubrobrunea]|nr:N-acetylglucosamine-6-phosphate deacetylase [Actinomadura rubrobrunea]
AARGGPPAPGGPPASRVPADLIGRGDLGRIAPGAAADLVWLGPDHRARTTWVAGSVVYQGAS